MAVVTNASIAERLPERTAYAVRLLGGFELRSGSDLVLLARNAQRVVAFLSVRVRPQLRATVASSLWLDTTEARAAANLRTALWKIRLLPECLVDSRGAYLALAPDTHVDLARLVAQGQRLIAPDVTLDADDVSPEALCGDLLPDWDEDWIQFERERLRQLRVHALEALCHRLSQRARHAEAVDAGLAAVAAEPLRESAQRALISAHLAEGNVSEAKRQFAMYRDLLWESLRIQPSDGLRAVLNGPA